MSEVRALGYLGFGASDIEEWKRFSQDILGLQLSETWDDGTIVLRED
ncbi:MAG: hypothetical protein H6879_00915 [Rhodobiaceae bacterium]|nr:hypothetical protein [Rhodobiaceae bacterium]